MKKINFVFVALIMAINCWSTVRTVNNNGGAQFTDIGSAVTAAVIGDTIYVCGSSTAYVGTSITKSNLIFIGAGFNPNKQNPVKTVLSSPWTIGNGNAIIGFELNGIVFTNSIPTNIRFGRCKMGNFNSTNNTFVNCMFDNCLWTTLISSPFSSQSFNGVVISNCLFHITTGASVFSSITLAGSSTVNHCTFIKEGSNGNLFGSVPSANGLNFTNNIFMNINPLAVSTNYQYTNNYSSVNLSSYGTGNIIGTTWPFITPQASVTGLFQFAWDFHLLPASPLMGVGSFGADLGIFGGANPYKTDGEPAIPQMDVMMLNGTQFTSGGTMNLQFQSTVQD